MIYLLRHGLDDETRIGGWSDVSLITEGRNQVIGARDFLLKERIHFDRIISSDVNRAKETALLINEAFSKNIEYSSVLRELNKGKLNGLPKDSVASEFEMFKGNPEIDVIYPDGESMQMFYDRIKRDLGKILSMDNALLVTHRGVINMIYFILNDIKLCNDKKMFGVEHASIHELDPVKKTIRRIY